MIRFQCYLFFRYEHIFFGLTLIWLSLFCDVDDDAWQQGRYANPDDEYPAVMQEWRAAADKNLQNYISQVIFKNQ